MNKLFKIYTILTVLANTQQQLNDCVGLTAFKNKFQGFFNNAFNIEDHLGVKYQKKDYLPNRFIARGEYSKSWLFRILAKDGVSKVRAAVKVQKYDNNYEVEDEVKFLATLAPRYPTLMLRYFGCAKIIEDGVKTLITFTEFLRYSLNDKAFQREFKKIPIKDQVSVFLLMSRGVLAFHKKGLAHLNIQPSSFGATETDFTLYKIMSYGTATKIGTDVFVESGYFADPLTFKRKRFGYKGIANKYKVSAATDVYQLGWTFNELLHGNEDIEDCKLEKTYQNVYNCAAQQSRKLYDIHLAHQTGYKNHKDKRKALDELIRSMVNVDFSMDNNGNGRSKKRATMDMVVGALIQLLRELDPRSIILPEKKEELFEETYEEFNDSNTPVTIGNDFIDEADELHERIANQQQVRNNLEERNDQRIRLAQVEERKDQGRRPAQVEESKNQGIRPAQNTVNQSPMRVQAQKNINFIDPQDTFYLNSKNPSLMAQMKQYGVEYVEPNIIDEDEERVSVQSLFNPQSQIVNRQPAQAQMMMAAAQEQMMMAAAQNNEINEWDADEQALIFSNQENYERMSWNVNEDLPRNSISSTIAEYGEDNRQIGRKVSKKNPNKSNNRGAREKIIL